MSESIVVFSGKNLKDFHEEGGIGWWTANKERAENLEYAIVTRCLTQEWAVHDVEQGTAVVICKLNGVVGKAIDSNRKCLEFDFYAKLHIPNAWQILTNNQRNPLKYYNTSELLEILKIDLNKLTWEKFNK